MLPLLITQTPASGKAPFGSTNDPLDADSTRYFPLVTATDRIAGYTRSCRARNWGSIPGCDLERLVLSLTSSSPATTLACPAWLARKCHLVNPACKRRTPCRPPYRVGRSLTAASTPFHHPLTAHRLAYGAYAPSVQVPQPPVRRVGHLC